MIAFASAIVDPAAYMRYARPGIEAVAEPGATVLALEAVGNVSRSNNLLLDAAARIEDLEALVLVDPHVEIADPDLCRTVRAALADPDTAVAGWAGAAGVGTIAWWEGRISAGDIVVAYDEFGGGRLPAWSWTTTDAPPAEVDAVDGRLVALSPWAVHNLRFDEGLHLGFGYDVDFCRQARSAGRKVATMPVRAVLHDKLALVRDRELWVEGHIHMAEKWDPGDEADWQARARRAEAERDAARTVSYSAATRVDALVKPLERELAEMTASRGWRLTAPLRALNRRLRRR